MGEWDSGAGLARARPGEEAALAAPRRVSQRFASLPHELLLASGPAPRNAGLCGRAAAAAITLHSAAGPSGGLFPYRQRRVAGPG